MSAQSLFTPVQMGELHLPNRIVMAPLTRMRAGSIDHVPTQIQADYYAQRASAGLIVAESPMRSMRPAVGSLHSSGTQARFRILTCGAGCSRYRPPMWTRSRFPSHPAAENQPSRPAR